MNRLGNRLVTNTVTAAKTAWWWLRQVLGDAAYENYLLSASRRAARASASCAHTRVPTREEFYLDALRRRYSTISRCC